MSASDAVEGTRAPYLQASVGSLWHAAAAGGKLPTFGPDRSAPLCLLYKTSGIGEFAADSSPACRARSIPDRHKTATKIWSVTRRRTRPVVLQQEEYLPCATTVCIRSRPDRQKSVMSS